MIYHIILWQISQDISKIVIGNGKGKINKIKQPEGCLWLYSESHVWKLFVLVIKFYCRFWGRNSFAHHEYFNDTIGNEPVYKHRK